MKCKDGFTGPVIQVNLKILLEQMFQSTDLNDMSVFVRANKNAAILNTFSTALAWVSLIFISLKTERESQGEPEQKERTKSNTVTLPYMYSICVFDS